MKKQISLGRWFKSASREELFPTTSLILSAKSIESQKFSSLAGNRTLVSRVTGGDTNHYTTKDCSTTWLDGLLTRGY